jgi:NitT/TauT family transport system ATP-binding protein
VVASLEVNLPHPRQRKSVEFQQVVDRVYSLLAGQTQPEHIEMGTAPGEPGRTRGLPNISIGDLSGLLEQLDELPRNRSDIYRLADDLGVDSDRLLELTEAAELLGFAQIDKGDITLTPLGETFAEASILARKEIFATRIRRVPIFGWLTSMLRASDKQQLRWEVVKTALELEFPPEETERQLERIVSWGRYAEVLAYDDDEEMLYLEARL